MSSISRPLTGPFLIFDLQDRLSQLRSEDAYGRSGRAGRTLAKSDRFRLIMVAMREGSTIGTHQADSPMTLQVISGAIRFRLGEEDHRLSAGELLFFGPGDAHDIRAEGETALLITISAIDADYGPAQGRSGPAKAGGSPEI